MNVLISVCEAFLQPAKVILYSLSRKNDDINVYLIYSSLKDTQIQEFGSYLKEICNA